MSNSEGARRKRSVVPRSVPAIQALVLAGIDAGVMFCLSLLALNGGGGSRLAAALIPAAVICAVHYLTGNYRRPLAVYVRDEAYYACAATLFAAIPVLLLLSAVDDVNPAIVLLALALCALGSSIAHVRFRLYTQPDTLRTYAGTSRVSMHAWQQREEPWFTLAKHLFDATVAVMALAVFSPIMIVSAIAIRMTSKGPIFFTQERVGRGGRPFRIIKFRTMRVDAGNEWAKPGDSRITRIGAILRRTSMDELPQLFNVLRGEMSIVGPRPEMADFATRFSATLPNYDQRHIVAPGITGWAQVYLKRNLTPDDMPDVLPYDLFYVEHSSLLLDAAIILKTACEVLFHRAV